MTALTPKDVLKRIHNSGSIFGATVETRSGETREFNAKTLPGDTFSERDEQHDLVTVWDNNANDGRGGYRSIALEGVREIRCGFTVRFPDLDE
jgi:hypothetical protein